MADVSISYKGNTIADMSASGTKTLLTADSYCENNIVVEYTKPTASDLVSGTLSITENGTGIDVTNYANVDVEVSGGGDVSHTVTFYFDRPLHSSSFVSCILREWNGTNQQAGQQIGEITSPTGSATVTTNTGGIMMELNGEYVVPPNDVSTGVWSTEKIGLASQSEGSPGQMWFVVGSDGEMHISSIDWSD